jgi:TetR/AcrR family transcriptional regulator, cholesterol catabolism regulator
LKANPVKSGKELKKTGGNFCNEKSFHSFAPAIFLMEPKQRILVKAEELFMQYGIRSVSMDDIANSLGMSKKTLYQYYADKDELVLGVVEGHITEMECECATFKHEAKDAIHEIFMTMEHITGELSNMNPMILYDMEKFHFRAYQRFQEHKNKFLPKIIKENMEWGIQDDLYRADINTDVLSKFRVESMLIPFNILLFAPGKYNLATTTEVILENFTYGLATVKGHKLIQKYNEQRKKNISYELVKK